MERAKKPRCLRDERYDHGGQGPCSSGQCKWPECKPKTYQLQDVESGTLIQRSVDAVWLQQELLRCAERLRDGSADNLDLYDAALNPTGCFQHQDVQTVFYELAGVQKRYTVSDKISAIEAASHKLTAASAN